MRLLAVVLVFGLWTNVSDAVPWATYAEKQQKQANRFDMTRHEREELRLEAKRMFYHGYNSYMEHAFPWDELKPLSCKGRRWDRRHRGDLDDTLGGFSMTLIDSLDMLAVVGDFEEFRNAVETVVETVKFDRDVRVSVFETTIRIIDLSLFVLLDQFGGGSHCQYCFDSDRIGTSRGLVDRRDLPSVFGGSVARNTGCHCHVLF